MMATLARNSSQAFREPASEDTASAGHDGGTSLELEQILERGHDVVSVERQPFAEQQFHQREIEIGIDVDGSFFRHLEQSRVLDKTLPGFRERGRRAMHRSRRSCRSMHGASSPFSKIHQHTRTRDYSRCRRHASTSISDLNFALVELCSANGWRSRRPRHDRVQGSVRPQRRPS